MVEPAGNRRFALTCRYIDPNLLKAEDREAALKKGQIPVDSYKFTYDGDQNLVVPQQRDASSPPIPSTPIPDDASRLFSVPGTSVTGNCSEPSSIQATPVPHEASQPRGAHHASEISCTPIPEESSGGETPDDGSIQSNASCRDGMFTQEVLVGMKEGDQDKPAVPAGTNEEASHLVSREALLNVERLGLGLVDASTRACDLVVLPWLDAMPKVRASRRPSAI